MDIIRDDIYCIRSTSASKDENPVVFQKLEISFQQTKQSKTRVVGFLADEKEWLRI